MSGSATPYYQLRVVSHDLACEIRVNDVPVLRLPSGHVETSFDVNPHVWTGSNTLALYVRAAAGKPGFGALSSCTVELGVKPTPAAEELTPLASLTFEAPTGAPTGFQAVPGGAGLTIRPGPAGLSASQSFDLTTPFQPWFWLSAPKIPATEATRAEVLALYRQLHGLLAARNLGALQSGCADQARDWQVAYGLPDLATAQRMLGIVETLSDPDIEVEPFPDDVLTMELLGDQRLVQLVDADALSPLRLRMKSADSMVGRFNVVLCRSGSNWAIAR